MPTITHDENEGTERNEARQGSTLADPTSPTETPAKAPVSAGTAATTRKTCDACFRSKHDVLSVCNKPAGHRGGHVGNRVDEAAPRAFLLRPSDGVSFRVSSRDARIIQKIVDRAESMARSDRYADRFDRLSASMDVTACHANGNPLRLEALLDADDFNFAHDFFGIQRHIDRATGQLGDCFSPRFSA